MNHDPKPDASRRSHPDKQDESDLSNDRCPDCGALSLEARTPVVGAGVPSEPVNRLGVPRGHGLTCENCGRMWTRKH